MWELYENEMRARYVSLTNDDAISGNTLSLSLWDRCRTFAINSFLCSSCITFCLRSISSSFLLGKNDAVSLWCASTFHNISAFSSPTPPTRNATSSAPELAKGTLCNTSDLISRFVFSIRKLAPKREISAEEMQFLTDLVGAQTISFEVHGERDRGRKRETERQREETLTFPLLDRNSLLHFGLYYVA